MSKATIAEISQQMGSGTKASEGDETAPKDDQDGVEKPKETTGKEKLGDWKRNGKWKTICCEPCNLPFSKTIAGWIGWMGK